MEPLGIPALIEESWKNSPFRIKRSSVQKRNKEIGWKPDQKFLENKLCQDEC